MTEESRKLFLKHADALISASKEIGPREELDNFEKKSAQALIAHIEDLERRAGYYDALKARTEELEKRGLL